MKKLTTLLISCLLMFGFAKAQYVNIPDSNFRAFLKSTYPAAFNANDQMDTTDTKILLTDSLTTYFNLLGGSATDTVHYQGLQYFKNLKFLYLEPMRHVSYAVIDKNVLPNGIKTMLFGGLGNVIFNTSKLPDSLEFFQNRSCNLFSGSNVVFPSGFKNFDFGGTRSYNPWINGNSFPATMETFKVDALMNYSPLANLPSGLKTFELNTCWGVTDFSYMTLPAGLQNLSFIDANRNIDTNTIVLPKLPSTLKTLSLNGTKTYCLPILPDSLQTLDITGASVACISKLPNAYLQVTPNTPICNTSNNANGCTVYGSTNYVNIPDSNFGKYLIRQIPSCLYKDSSNKYWMDTTCTGVINTRNIICSNLNIMSIEGVQFFKSLNHIECNFNSLTSLPDIQNLNSLIYLGISYNNILSLPILSNSIDSLFVNNNQLTNLPDLPSSLKILTCYNNNIHCLPFLPDSLEYLGLDSYNIKCLPNKPKYSPNFGVANNGILVTIPICNYNNNPNSCTVFVKPNYINIPDSNFAKYLIGKIPSCLYKDSNNLYWMDTTCTGVLGLHNINCSNLNIKSIDGIQYFKGLTYLNCSNNQISTLNITSTNQLTEIYADSNQLSVIYNLTIKDTIFSILSLKGNLNLSCLPKLPHNLGNLDVTGTNVQCIPNLIYGHWLNNFPPPPPLCNSTNNPNNCNIYYNYVNIPDSNFANYLITEMPSCLFKDNNNLYWMDSTCNMVMNSDTLLPKQLKIVSLEGIQYFKSLKYLDCSRNYFLNNLPFLSNTLLYLNCSINSLKSIPTLPNGLKYLDCSNNNYSLSILPQLPTSLLYLDCSFDSLTNLPQLPLGIRKINCGHNYLSTLPSLPDSLEYLECYSNNLTSLISFPYNLKHFGCSNNQISILPILPNLSYLDCRSNNLLVLPNLPNSIDTLYCGLNKLNTLPILPNSLLALDCYSNPNLHCLPTLPITLKGLYLDSLNIHCLPNLVPGLKVFDIKRTLQLPVCNATYNPNGCSFIPINNANYINIPDSNFAEYLITLIPICLYKDSNNLYWMDTTGNGVLNTMSIYCSNLNIKSIEGIQYFKGLQYLDCSYNLIDSLPNINSYLYELTVSNNKLKSLPLSLKFSSNNSWVDCSNNFITSIPSWFSNNRLAYFNCSNNLINSVPNFPPDDTSSTYIVDTIGFYANGNPNLSCLPHLPNYLVSLGVNQTNVTCLPNILHSLPGTGWVPQISPANLTVCNPTNNANQCQAFPIVHGKVFTDDNSNGIKDGNEYYRPFVQLNNSNGTTIITNTNGEYTLGLTDTGTYTLTTVVPAGFKAVPTSNTFSFNNNVSTLSLPDIALQPINTNDSLTVFIMPLLWAKPGQEIQYFVSYENAGSVLANDTVKIVYDTAHLIFDSCSMPVISHTGNTIITSNNVLTPGDYNYFFAYFTVKTTAVLGDSVYATASIASANTAATYLSYEYVVSSFDPNNKDATPELSPVQVQNGTFIDYNIHFQNTGNDTAFNVVLADTLSALLKNNILQVVASSHPCNVTMKDSIIYFEFLKINLPDSNVNKFRSNGFVHFRLLPQTNVPIGSRINNKASIYFDYNSAVVTNTASTWIKPYGVPVIIRNYSVTAERTGDNQGAVVINKWSVSTEINIANYTIQRSIDNRDFNTAGAVNANGLGEYSFTDNPPAGAKVLYYRLKISDKDGHISYSDVKQIIIQPKKLEVTIYPNPAKNFIMVKGERVTQINIIDNAGRVVLSKTGLNALVAENKVNINLADGVYVLQVKMVDGSFVNDKLIIKN